MPIFVWIAIAIAILLVGAGTATKLAAAPIVTAMNGPVGYILVALTLVLIGVAIWKKKPSQ